MSIESVKEQYQQDLGKYADNEKERQFIINSIDKIFDDFRIHFATKSDDDIELTPTEYILDGMFRKY